MNSSCCFTRGGPAGPRLGPQAAPATVLPICASPFGPRHNQAASAFLAASSTRPWRPLIGCPVRASDGISPGKLDWAATHMPDGPPLPPVSRSDEDFAALGVEFVTTRDGIKVTELNELFEKVGFPRRDPELLKVALSNTYRLVWVRSTKQSRVSRMGQLLGFARATSDGVFNATIWDVAVAPAWQRSGLGRAMMERLLVGLAEDGIPTVTLYAEPKVVALYRKLGFVSDVDGIKGMAFQRREPAGGQKQQQGARR